MRVFLCLCLMLPTLAWSHAEDEPPLPPLDTVQVPQNIDIFAFLRFTQYDHRLVLAKILAGDTHHIGTMTVPLTQAALDAARHDPRGVGIFVFDMAKLSDWDSRAAFLNAEQDRLSARFAEVTAQWYASTSGTGDVDAAEALTERRVILRSKLALIRLWLENPMDGAGSL